MESKILK